MLVSEPAPVRKFSLEKTSSTRLDRVPQSLQAVLIQASRGCEVTKAPPNRVATRNFYRLFTKTAKASIDFQSDSSEFGTDDVVSQAGGGNSVKVPQSAPAPVAPLPISPHSYLISMVQSRGYSVSRFKALQTAYYNKPSPVQVASYGSKLVEAIRSDDTQFIRDAMEAGLSPNACNEHGESVVHLTCRLGKKNVLDVLIDYGCTLQVADDYGRTPLHDACWSTDTNFDVVDLILGQDPELMFVEDSRGALPLGYVRENQWAAWTKYLVSRKDRFWPVRDLARKDLEGKSSLTLDGPNMRPIPSLKGSVPLEIIRMVAQGLMHPMEATLLRDDNVDETCEESYDSDYCESDDNESSYDDEECEEEQERVAEVDWSDDSSEMSFDEEEMNEVLCFLRNGKEIAWTVHK